MRSPAGSDQPGKKKPPAGMKAGVPFSIDGALAELDSPRRREAGARLAELRELLHGEHGLAVRGDSRLAFLFATECDPGQAADAMPEVVLEMAHAQRLYGQTPLAAAEPALREVADLLKAEFPFVDWGLIWKYTRTHVHALLKLRAVASLDARGGA